MATDSTIPTVPSQRPKRADARRNYDKLIAAAREAFTEHDSTASLEDIARRAGVGIGTLYRHFPTRQDLLEAVYVEEVEAICRSADDLADARRRGTRSPPGCTGSSATPRPSRRWPRSSSTTSTPTTRCSAPAARPSTAPATRCSSAPRRPATCGPTPAFTDVGRMVGGIATIPAAEPGADRAHPRPRARRPALPARRVVPSAVRCRSRWACHRRAASCPAGRP